MRGIGKTARHQNAGRPFATSRIATTTPALTPDVRSTLAAPMLPLPMRCRSRTPHFRARSSAKGMDPMRYAQSTARTIIVTSLVQGRGRQRSARKRDVLGTSGSQPTFEERHGRDRIHGHTARLRKPEPYSWLAAVAPAADGQVRREGPVLTRIPDCFEPGRHNVKHLPELASPASHAKPEHARGTVVWEHAARSNFDIEASNGNVRRHHLHEGRHPRCVHLTDEDERQVQLFGTNET